jgi:hypothetical protein
VRAYQTSKVKAGRGNLRQTPQAPASVTAAKTDEVTIVISWQDPADQVSLVGYNVYRSFNGGSYQFLDTVAPVAYPATTSYTDETLPVGLYTYRVGCQAATIESTRTTSNTVQIVASAQDEWAANTPSGFAFTLGTPSRVSLAAYRPQSEPYLTMSSLAGFTLDDSTDELVYDGTGSVGQYTITVDSAAAVFGWTIPDVTLALNPSEWSTGASPASGVGATYDLSQYANHAGTTPVYSITSGGGTGISIDASTGLLTVGPTAAAVDYSVVVELTASTDESDWLSRSQGDGVVWAHDFRNASAFTNWAILSTTPYPEYPDDLAVNSLTRDMTDGFGSGGCLRQYVPAGKYSRDSWVRPFTNDPYADGFTLADWFKYRKGLFGHSDYHATTRPSGNPTSAWSWAGTDFWIQYRVKFSASYFSKSLQNNSGTGKVSYIDICGGGSQEANLYAPLASGGTVTDWGKRFAMYTNFSRSLGGSQFYSPFLIENQNVSMTDPQQQPGGDFPLCKSSNLGACWEWPTDERVTVMFHITPGHHNLAFGASGCPNLLDPSTLFDTRVEAWVAETGATAWSKVLDEYFAWYFEAQYETSSSAVSQGATGWGPNGFNVLSLNAYMGPSNLPSEVAWERKFTQIILSTSEIALPAA